jgi:hypothetical protein
MHLYERKAVQILSYPLMGIDLEIYFQLVEWPLLHVVHWNSLKELVQWLQ